MAPKQDILFNSSFIQLAIIYIQLFISTLFHRRSKVFGSFKSAVTLSVIVFALLWIYRKLFHSNPADTFWSMDINLMKDGIFNFIYVLLFALVIICIS
jgi:hypothetical protein